MPRLPRKVPRRHRRPIPAQARHQSQPSAISATPATQNEGRCHQVPRLPRETKVDVAKCHACHAKCRGVTGDQSQPKRATRASPVPKVPHLPRKTKVDVYKCHACHAKRRWMSPSATPATQSAAGCHQGPRLPRKMKVDVAKRHACHAKRRWMSPSAMQACHAKCRGVTGDQSQPKRATRANAISATPAAQNEGRCHQVPRETKVDVSKCHSKVDVDVTPAGVKMVADKDGV